MANSDPVQCPMCGWTGTHADLERTNDDTVCPACRSSTVG